MVPDYKQIAMLPGWPLSVFPNLLVGGSSLVRSEMEGFWALEHF